MGFRCVLCGMCRRSGSHSDAYAGAIGRPTRRTCFGGECSATASAHGNASDTTWNSGCSSTLPAWRLLPSATHVYNRGRTGVQLKDKWRNLVKFQHVGRDEAGRAPVRSYRGGFRRRVGSRASKSESDAAAGGRDERQCVPATAEALPRPDPNSSPGRTLVPTSLAPLERHLHASRSRSTTSSARGWRTSAETKRRLQVSRQLSRFVAGIDS